MTLIVFGFLVVIIGFWSWFYLGISKYERRQAFVDPSKFELPSVSVIVVFKNEGNKLVSLIGQLLNQDYPNFEIIAMDDFSTDNVSQELAKISDSRLKIYHASVDLPGKKAALSEAIKLAHHELILLTDGDCLPNSKHWIKSMVNAELSNKKSDVVLGYGPMLKDSGFVNRFARYETFITAMQYFTYSIFRLPYMGVGRNLMYKKSLFLELDGFSSHQNIISGDDDLFISSLNRSKNVAINLDKESFMYSESKTNLTSFLRQKSRHISTSVHYKWKHKILLGLFAGSHIGLYVALVFAWTLGLFSLGKIVAILLLKWSVQMIYHEPFLKKLDGQDLRFWFPFLDITMFVYMSYIGLYSMFTKQKW